MAVGNLDPVFFKVGNPPANKPAGGGIPLELLFVDEFDGEAVCVEDLFTPTTPPPGTLGALLSFVVVLRNLAPLKPRISDNIAVLSVFPADPPSLGKLAGAFLEGGGGGGGAAI